ncbi:MAG: hypothetical protein NXI21_01900 [Alphaproteobacteria bacterium]|nr:hypothetical protein [Alphaproteobacteria bacterium]
MADEQPRCMHCEILQAWLDLVEQSGVDRRDPRAMTDLFERFFDEVLSGLAATTACIQDDAARTSWVMRADAMFGPAVEAHRRGEHVFRPRQTTRH